MSGSVDGFEKPDRHVVIVGAGFAGLCSGIKLKQAGIEDFLIVDRNDDIGGTWMANHYPGVAVDIPSFTYQFSFEMNPNWSRVFAPGAEIKSYIDHCADKYDLRRHVRLNCNVTGAEFDESQHLWRISTADGPITARYLISAVGALSQPKLPDIAGLEDYTGTMLHTAQWDDDIDLDDKRVAVIGTGATAVQLVPAIADRVKRMYVYQRTPIWVLPKPDPKLGPLPALFRTLPATQWAARAGSTVGTEAVMVTSIVNYKQFPLMIKAAEAIGKLWIRAQVPDPVVRAKLTPSYGFGCKRPSTSNHYFATYARDHVELVTDPIATITETGIRTADGVEREVDVLILATGFYTTEMDKLPPFPVLGRNGESLGERFAQDRLKAYEGVSAPGFPNAFLTFGPYAFSGSSFLAMIENQVRHIVRAISEADRREATLVEVKQEPHDKFFDKMIARQPNTLFFSSNCTGSNSYYFDAHGDAPLVRPTTSVNAWWRSGHYALDDYTFAQQEAPTTRPRRRAAKAAQKASA